MTAYVIADIVVKDPERFARYKEMVPPTIEKFGGRYLARGGETEVLEGDWQVNRLVILEFESVARAKEWLESDEYAEARKLRRDTTDSKLVVVEGLER